MYKLIIASLILFNSCSSFQWNDVEIQGIKKKADKTPKAKKIPPDPRNLFVGRFKFVGANIERGSGQLVHIKTCPKDSLFIEKNDFRGLSLSFREKGQYFYDNIFFINSKPPLNWMIEEDLKTIQDGNFINQSRKSIRQEKGNKVYLEYLTTLERTDDLLFYSSKVTIYRPNPLFYNEFIPDYLGELHCAYGFDSLTSEQKKAQVKDMGY